MSLLLPLKETRTRFVDEYEIVGPTKLEIIDSRLNEREIVRLHGIYVPEDLGGEWAERVAARFEQYCTGNGSLLATTFGNVRVEGERTAIVSMMPKCGEWAEHITANYCLVRAGFARVNYEGWRIMREIKKAEEHAGAQRLGFWQDLCYASKAPAENFNSPFGTIPPWIALSRWITRANLKSANEFMS